MTQIPPNRCGHLTKTSTTHNSDVDYGNASCWRTTWGDWERCIWHAKEKNKSTEELCKARTGKPERLDGAFLAGATLSEIPFEGCTLRKADLTGSSIEKTDFTDADLSHASLDYTRVNNSVFKYAKLSETTFHDTKIKNSCFENSDLRGAKLIGENTDLVIWNSNLNKSILSKATIEGADFSETSMNKCLFISASISKNCTFAGCDLHAADFEQVEAVNLDLTEADLSNATLEKALLEGCDLTGADLTGANLSSATFFNTNFTKSNLPKATLAEADLGEANFSQANIEYANFHKANLYRANLKKSNAEGAIFTNADLSGADLSSACFRGANMANSSLDRTLMIEANCSRTNFSHTTLTEANLTDANLTESELDNATISNADLSRVNLTYADLEGTNLQGTNLINANLQGTSFIRTDIRYTEFGEIENQSGVELNSATKVKKICRNPDTPRDWDQLSQKYGDFREHFRESALVEQQRDLYYLQRKARGEEWKTGNGRLINITSPKVWGNRLSRILTGHGVRARYVIFWMLLLFAISTFWYISIGDDGVWVGGALYYSVSAFVAVPPHPPSEIAGIVGKLTTIVVLIETYLGTTFIILTGYVLGNRDPI